MYDGGYGNLKILDVVEKVTRKIAPGPTPSFNEAHVVKVLELVSSNETVGRIRLSKELSLGEGTTRTLLKHLKNEGITQSSRSGIKFTDTGAKLFSDLQSRLSEGVDVPSSPLTVGAFNIAILVKDTAKTVKSGMEQRDAAIKSGALGATTLVFRNNKLSLPTGEEAISKDMHDELILQFHPAEDDVIIVGSAENKEAAEIGAKMAALKLLKSSG
jgi:predicted transcriptional regulator